MAYGVWPTRTNLIALDNNVMHAKPDLRVLLKWMIASSGSVITDVIRHEQFLSIFVRNLVDW